MFLTSPATRQPLILYSVKTGAVPGTWTTAGGIISGTGPMGGSGAGPGTALRWTADGKELAFAFYASAKPGKDGWHCRRGAPAWLSRGAAAGLLSAHPGPDRGQRGEQVLAVVLGQGPGR